MSISEQVKELREVADCYYGEISSYAGTIRKAADTIESLAKLQAENCGGGWIYCGDGKNLPPDGQKVLLSCKYIMFEYVTVGTIENGNRGKSYIADEETFMRSAIIAWKPLPEPHHEP